MKKTIKQWLNELEEPYRTQALEYAKKHWENDGGIDENHSKSLSQSILAGFIFTKTREGADYWWRLFERIDAQEGLKR